MTRILWSFIFLLFILVFPNRTLADEDYVLPYPPVMPGSFAYKIRLVIEEMQKYWYFGSFSQFKYNLKQSDKYLVEAKTLFEYKQYLLAYNALKKSGSYLESTFASLLSAKKEGKSIEEKRKILSLASLKHKEVLEEIKNKIPETFVWTPEKTEKITLNLHEEIDSVILLRSKYE